MTTTSELFEQWQAARMRIFLARYAHEGPEQTADYWTELRTATAISREVLSGRWVAVAELLRHGAAESWAQQKILDLLTDLVKVGPAAGIILVLATQKPDSKVMPDKLRGQIGTRFAMRVMNWQASETILGAGTYSTGLDASTFLQSHKGVGILLGGDDGELADRGAQTLRTHLLADEDLKRLCSRGRALRMEIGTLTGMAAGEMPAESFPSRVLEDLADVFQPGEDKAHTEVLLDRLADKDPETYDGWTPNQLAMALKPSGVKSKQSWAIGADGARANRQGYARESVIGALAARIDQGDN
jgi:S-DNA-T family DNA segregation ATPase FtsK/SpoIIIE